MAHYVFIDTNMLLSLYDYTDDDLNKLQAFAEAVQNGQIVVYLPYQTEDEFARNRDGKIADVIRDLDAKVKSDISLPRICEGFEEREAIVSAMKALAEAKAALLASVTDKAKKAELLADSLIQSIFEMSKRIGFSDKLLAAAKIRHDHGRPPGKRDSLGDQINWECLLADVPKSIPLHVLSRDKDWKSKLTGELHPYLLDEWRRRKSAECRLVDSLNKFLKLMDLKIEISEDPQKDFYVQKLCNSGSFATTHAAIAELQNYDIFNPHQVDLMIKSFLVNSQVGWIAGDPDVNKFYSDLIANHAAIIEPEMVDEVLKQLNPPVVELNDNEIPF